MYKVKDLGCMPEHFSKASFLLASNALQMQFTHIFVFSWYFAVSCAVSTVDASESEILNIHDTWRASTDVLIAFVFLPWCLYLN
jgi:hypothetical protein